MNALEKELDRLHEARDESSGLVTVFLYHFDDLNCHH